VRSHDTGWPGRALPERSPTPAGAPTGPGRSRGAGCSRCLRVRGGGYADPVGR